MSTPAVTMNESLGVAKQAGVVGPDTTLYPTGSLRAIMDVLEPLENRIRDYDGCNDIRVYRWQEPSMQAPALWNWIAPSPFVQRDTSRFQDIITLVINIGYTHNEEADQQMLRFELVFDAARDLIDNALWTSKSVNGVGPLNGTVTSAVRTSMSGPSEVDVNTIPWSVVQFPIQLTLNRRISPTGQ